MMTDRQRRDYFFFVMKSWRMEMERSQQYMKAMEKAADAESGGPAGTQASAASHAPRAGARMSATACEVSWGLANSDHPV